MRPNHPVVSALALVIAGSAFLSSCASQVPPPQPAPSPSPTAPPPAPPRPVQRSDDWRDVPATPGEWRWSIENGQSVARFAGGQLVLRCDRTGGTVTLLRAGGTGSDAPMTVLTTHGSRAISGRGVQGPPPAVAASFSAGDPFLDAIAFSRGRFAVEVTGLPTLYVPSWPEVSRVIEDCR